jgi:hypothetical protein
MLDDSHWDLCLRGMVHRLEYVAQAAFGKCRRETTGEVFVLDIDNE